MTDTDFEAVNFCCEELEDAVSSDAEASLIEHDSGLILLNLGQREVDGETGAVLTTIRFCPFCGTEIQTDEDIEAALGAVETYDCWPSCTSPSSRPSANCSRPTSTRSTLRARKAISASCRTTPRS